MEKEEKFRSMFKGCYAELRAIFKRLLNVETMELQVVDESMNKSIEETLSHQKACMEKAQLDVKA